MQTLFIPIQKKAIKIFENVKDEFETIAGIVEESSTWTEAK